MILRGVAVLVALCVGVPTVTAQSAGIGYPYPANDVPLKLLWGTVVRQRDVVIFRGQHTSSLTIVIETPSPASDSARVAREANEVANLHSELAVKEGVSRITVSICRTRACIEMRELSAELFHFVRSASGAWVADPAYAR